MYNFEIVHFLYQPSLAFKAYTTSLLTQKHEPLLAAYTLS